MNARPNPSSPPSSHGYANLELEVPLSLRLLALSGAWGAVAGVAIFRASLPLGTRLVLFSAFALALYAGLRRLLPGVAGVAALRLDGADWWVRCRGCWHEAELQRALELPQRGWWLQWRLAGDRGTAWAWLDADRQPAGPYRALCRALRRPAVVRAGVAGERVGAVPAAPRESRRRSRDESRADP